MSRASDRIRRLEAAAVHASGMCYLISDEPLPDRPEAARAALHRLAQRCGRFGFAVPYELMSLEEWEAGYCRERA
jgi:hypothetical protein